MLALVVGVGFTVSGCATSGSDIESYRNSASVQAACAHYKRASYDLEGAEKLGALDDYENCVSIRAEELARAANSSDDSSQNSCLAVTGVLGLLTFGIAWLALPFCFLA